MKQCMGLFWYYYRCSFSAQAVEKTITSPKTKTQVNLPNVTKLIIMKAVIYYHLHNMILVNALMSTYMYTVHVHVYYVHVHVFWYMYSLGIFYIDTVEH